ncbi:LytR/AlgR family response regulator transcription factor [Pedobacter duraquae]|uniref:LytTR family two component transcriptional regulator n=1 Tax=Pedobacter duraquae TaxID=425511 RepID=A0A4R6IP25_9SPHI|nr:LytTR family DNA-binding domain-containing protein [Pedobacter duraquae]TDO23746.1 LytTR family two component transcriptional regulator [Pedobacter duraquae]
MNNYSCIIIDDDPSAIELLEDYIGQMENLYTLASYTDPLLAMAEFAAMQKPVDFLFLDMQMPKMNGDVLYAAIRNKVDHLFVITAYGDSAMAAFDDIAVAFLHKPIRQAKFINVVTRLLSPRLVEIDSIMLPVTPKGELITINLANVIAVKSEANYIRIFTAKDSLQYYYSITSIERDFSPYAYFLRINRSFIISTKHIRSMNPNFVRLSNGMKIAVTKTYYERFISFSDKFRKD